MKYLLLLLFPIVTHAQIFYGMGRYSHKDYINVLNKAQADAVTKPSYEQKVKHNALVRRWDSYDDVWTHKDIVYVFFHDAVEEFSYYNWRPANLKLVKSGTTTWTDNTGSQGNGSTGYYNTLYTGGGGYKYQQDNASTVIDVRTKSTINPSTYYGKRQNPTNYTLMNFSGGTRLNTNNSTTAHTPTTFITSLICVQRDNSANIDIYENGILDKNDQAQTSTAIDGLNFFIHVSNLAGSPDSFSDGVIGMIGFGETYSNTLGEYNSWINYTSNP